jgi:hypothetical protein
MDIKKSLRIKLNEYDLSYNVNYLTLIHHLQDLIDTKPEIFDELNRQYGIEDITAKSGNKIVGKSGEPLEMFHAGTADFKNIDPNRANKVGHVRGAFFTPVEDTAKSYEKDAIGMNPDAKVNLHTGYLDLKNPKRFGVGQGFSYFYTSDVEELKNQGYDGIIATIRDVADAYEIVAFYKKSIKPYRNIFDAYVKSKKLGNNPDLVKKVEELLSNRNQ